MKKPIIGEWGEKDHEAKVETDYIFQQGYLTGIKASLGKLPTTDEKLKKKLCGVVIMTPTPIHDGGRWCAELKPCKYHSKGLNPLSCCGKCGSREHKMEDCPLNQAPESKDLCRQCELEGNTRGVCDRKDCALYPESKEWEEEYWEIIQNHRFPEQAVNTFIATQISKARSESYLTGIKASLEALPKEATEEDFGTNTSDDKLLMKICFNACRNTVEKSLTKLLEGEQYHLTINQ